MSELTLQYLRQSHDPITKSVATHSSVTCSGWCNCTDGRHQVDWLAPPMLL